MSLEKAEKYLEEKGFLDHVIELEASTATVTEAAEANGWVDVCKETENWSFMVTPMHYIYMKESVLPDLA
ncbi:hypothetical protein [Blautia sp. HCP3S3_C4]|uniref:hypothetical protein n=1 Tax=Blautia sp. HCP3S3_C4 TaxID=3438911 RepID=UPI003F89D68A